MSLLLLRRNLTLCRNPWQNKTLLYLQKPARNLSTKKPGKEPVEEALEYDDDWNNAWDSSWIPEDNKNNEDSSSSSMQDPYAKDIHKKRYQIETLMNRITGTAPTPPSFEDMDDIQASKKVDDDGDDDEGDKVRGMAVVRERDLDYRLRKQKLHASMWHHEIDVHLESKLNDGVSSPAAPSLASTDDIDQLLEKCSEFFDYDDPGTSPDMNSKFKVVPDGWESTNADNSGKPWEMSQKEEDILLQEFERRIAFNKIQISNFIKGHIFSRRRPIDGWKYMIEDLGPSAKRLKDEAPDPDYVDDPKPFDERTGRHI